MRARLAALVACARAWAPPPAPWRFGDARVLYQPTFVRAAAARAATPRDGVALLSLFGWTLGGVFVVDWRESPVGPYREVAVLSGLVARGGAVGAWASHVVVTTPEAAAGGREIYGLPTVLGSIAFAASDEPDADAWRRELRALAATSRAVGEAAAAALKAALGAAGPGAATSEELRRPAPREPADRGFAFEADGNVAVAGWDGWRGAAPPGDGARASLPSFSGRLDAAAPLLRYPLRLGPARRVALRPAMPTRCAAAVSPVLAAVLDGPRACPCLQVDAVVVEAGAPRAVD